MIENASWEEDDELQDIWCRLIVNGLDPSFNSEIRYAFIEIIKNLTSLDAKILKYTYDSASRDDIDEYSDSVKYQFIKHHSLPVHSFKDVNNVDQGELETSLDNLLRVGCLQNSVFADYIEKGWDFGTHSPPPDRFHLTQLGIMFVEACLGV